MSWRRELFARIKALDAATPAQVMVLLWSAYAPKLQEVENELRGRGTQPQRLRRAEVDFAKDLHEWLAKDYDTAATFDRRTLSLITALDRFFANGSPSTLPLMIAEGVDGTRYVIRHRNNPLARMYEYQHAEPTWSAHQDRSMYAYARHTIVMPYPEVPGRTGIRTKSAPDWADGLLRSRLLSARRRFSVLLWPFSTPIEYPGLDALTRTPPAEFVTLTDPRNDDQVCAEISRAIAVARDQEATILVFPELSISKAALHHVEAILANRDHGPDGFPILTLLGLCHAQVQQDDREWDVNEAVLLGPDGVELHRHRKMHCYSARLPTAPDDAIGERLLVGQEITILESPIGNLATLICLDLFHEESLEVLRRSHANMMLVPSLSPKTSAHARAASALEVSQLAATFVCNRWFNPDHEPSFCMLPRKRGRYPEMHERPAREFILFHADMEE